MYRELNHFSFQKTKKKRENQEKNDENYDSNHFIQNDFKVELFRVPASPGST